MPDTHLTRELLRAVLRNELPAGVLTQIGLQHLLNICPTCRREFQAFQLESRGGTSMSVVSASLGAQVSLLEGWERRAERDLRDLIALPKEERTKRVERARSRFRGSCLVHLLLEEGQRRLISEPRDAYHFAELAHLVLKRSPFGPEMLGLLALTIASMGNAVRVAGDLLKAEGLFAAVRQLIVSQGVTDAAVLARIEDLEGSLRKDQRRFRQAVELFTRAALLYQFTDDRAGLAGILVKLGATFHLQGKPARALELTRAALKEISPEGQPRLCMNARYNLALFLVVKGEIPEAEVVLAADADFFRGFPEPGLELRLTGLRGKIAAARGDLAAAEEAFVTMREGFLRHYTRLDAALISMDLALLYRRQGRTEEMRSLAEDMLAVFMDQRLDREIKATLALLK